MPASFFIIDALTEPFKVAWSWANHPMNADKVNGAFELIGAVAAWMNVVIYLKHRAIQGVFWPSTLFYSTWGLWNLVYYSALGQPLSFWGGAALTSGSGAWVLLVAYDKWKAQRALKTCTDMSEHATAD